MPETATVPPPPVDDELLLAVAEGRHHDPHSVLGAHSFEVRGEGGSHTAIRVRRPLAASVDALLDDGGVVPLAHVAHGIWAGAGAFGAMGYRVRARYEGGGEWIADDPYRYAPTIGELDLHLIAEGRHEELWKVLGAHHRVYDSPVGALRGVSFSVWAPRARAVRVVGDFNDWDGTGHAMRNMGAS
jgi:1,4-alpha-glucan branching enzyme